MNYLDPYYDPSPSEVSSEIFKGNGPKVRNSPQPIRYSPKQLIDAGFNASSESGKGHHSAINPLINAVTGKPTEFTDQNGSISVGPGSIAIQGPNIGFNLNQGGIGGSYTTDDRKTSVSVGVNPFQRDNFGAQVGFSHGGIGHTPVPTKFDIEGLDKPSAQAESSQQTAAQVFLKNQLDQIHEGRVKANPSWYKKPSIN
jgi:hypothetical protein